jgi:hypothetical protein
MTEDELRVSIGIRNRPQGRGPEASTRAAV